MVNILKVVQAGHPVLRQRARPLTAPEILSPEVAGLIEDMRETMRDAPGVGLAAPQVGLPLQLIVVEDKLEYIERASDEEAQARGRSPVPFQVLVNPTLTFVDHTPEVFFEGCLSFADFMMVVSRARAVRVDGLDHRAKPVSLSWTGWPARILQHEIDHLHGVLCVDRMLPRTLTSVRNHARYWSSQSIAELLQTLGGSGNIPETRESNLRPNGPRSDSAG